MKKNLILTFSFLLVSFVAFAGKFILIPVTETNNLESLFSDNDLKIHYYCDNYVLATADVVNYHNASVLDENAFVDVSAYAIVYCYNHYKKEYLSTVSKSDKVLYSGDNFLIMKILSNNFMPAKNDGMVAIRNVKASLPRYVFDYPVITEEDETILGFISEVVADTLMTYIQIMEDYVTRRCDHANSVLAQNWIKDKFESYGLSPFIHALVPPPYIWWGGTCQSGNVIAIQYGTEFPDEYIVCGGHYDSFAWQSPQGEPGADDNASGTAGIMETARILSQYNFKRSIIYCAFAAEEAGLYGSDYYAQKCSNDGMNILGYFNLDMIGYVAPGSQPQISLLYPTSALSLANYFANVHEVYFPDVTIQKFPNHSLNAQSDHASFNKYGILGIWPFEVPGGSPEIHTPNDKIGPSVNNPEQVKLFTQVTLASIAILALPNSIIPPPPIAPPTNCKAEYIENEGINITWDAPAVNTPVIEYNVYRDSAIIDQTVVCHYLDTVKEVGLYCYMVTAIFNVNDEMVESGFSNEDCDSIPLIDNILEYKSDFKIYPNPTTGQLTIENGQLIIDNIEIFDVYGRKQSSHHPSSSHHTIDVAHLPAGTYLIKIGNEFVEKFVKK